MDEYLFFLLAKLKADRLQLEREQRAEYERSMLREDSRDDRSRDDKPTVIVQRSRAAHWSIPEESQSFGIR